MKQATPNYKAELVALFGHPVAENPTVVMQEAAFRELGLNWRYLTVEVYPEHLGNAIQGLRAFNMRGANLTIPHKVEVLKYLDEVAQSAQLMGAVNTVVRRGDRLVGENTDGKYVTFKNREGEIMTLSGEEILVAMGRSPNVSGLGLENIGITFTNKGVEVDSRLRTSHQRSCGKSGNPRRAHQHEIKG